MFSAEAEISASVVFASLLSLVRVELRSGEKPGSLLTRRIEMRAARSAERVWDE